MKSICCRNYTMFQCLFFLSIKCLHKTPERGGWKLSEMVQIQQGNVDIVTNPEFTQRKKMAETTLPINLDILKKRDEIPIKLAELSYNNSERAVTLLRKWGEKKSPITELHKELCKSLRREDIY